MSGVIVSPYAFAATQTVYDLEEDFGGSLEDWLTFYAAAPAGHYQLNIPAGSYGVYGVGDARFAIGNTRATIQGAGMDDTFMTINTITGLSGLEPNQPEPRIASVSAGSSTVTLLDLDDASRFTSAVPDVGNQIRGIGWYVCIMGWAMQLGGNPANNQFFEFKRVVDVNDITGVITFDEPLENSYSADWPAILPGVPGATVDCAGAATCYLMCDFDLHYGVPPWPWPLERLAWDQELIIRDLTIANTVSPDQTWFGASRTVLYERVRFPGFSGTATVGQSVIYNECEFGGTGGSIEIDKFVELLEFNDCSFDGVNGIILQSSSVALYRLNNCTFNTGFTSLGGRTFEATDCSFASVRPGPSSYGASESGTITNCSATGVDEQLGRHFPYSSITDITDGIITIDYSTWLNSDALVDMTPLTACCLLATTGNKLRSFNILSAEYDSGGDNMLFTTDLPDPIPEESLIDTIFPHPCKSITISGCTGGLANYNGHNAQPWGEVVNMTNLSGANGSIDAGAYCFGNIVSITVNVSQAYTGVASVVKLRVVLGRVLLDADHTAEVYVIPRINLKITGTRVMIPGSATGAQSGDSLVTFDVGDNWLTGGVQAQIVSNDGGDPLDISGESDAVRPIYTVTVLTDQGL